MGCEQKCWNEDREERMMSPGLDYYEVCGGSVRGFGQEGDGAQLGGKPREVKRRGEAGASEPCSLG